MKNSLKIELTSSSKEKGTPIFVHELNHYEEIEFSRNHNSVIMDGDKLAQFQYFLLGLWTMHNDSRIYVHHLNLFLESTKKRGK